MLAVEWRSRPCSPRPHGSTPGRVSHPQCRVLLHSRPCSPLRGGSIAIKPCFREPYGVMDARTMQRATLKPKGCCASPSSRAAELLCNSPAWRAPRPRHGWRAVRMELHPKSLCASPPSCAQLSPLPDVPLWPLTACQALQGRPALTTRFPRLPGRLTALPRWGTSPLWRLPSWQGAVSRARPLPRGSRRNKCPVCAGGREAPVPAVGAAEARTPRLRTMGRQSRGCRLGFARSGGCRARPVPLPSAAWPARCRRLPQAPGGSSSKRAGVL